MLRAELKILVGKHQGKAIPLTSRKFLVGREQDCQLRPNSDLVSRHHCAFSIDDYAVRLRDLGSTNGTFVNGEAIKGEVRLENGDKISIGKLDLQLTINANVQVEPPAEVPSVDLSSGSAVMGTTSAPVADTAAQETSYELPAYVPGADTAIHPQGAPMMAPGMMPGYPMPGMPMPGYGMPAYGMPQPGYPMGNPYGMPYGGPMMPGYPMPGYNQMPMGGYPTQPQGQPQGQPQPGPGGVEEPALRLPDPNDTGARDIPKPAPVAGATGGPAENPSGMAGDIIKQYLQRRGTR